MSTTAEDVVDAIVSVNDSESAAGFLGRKRSAAAELAAYVAQCMHERDESRMRTIAREAVEAHERKHNRLADCDAADADRARLRAELERVTGELRASHRDARMLIAALEKCGYEKAVRIVVERGTCTDAAYDGDDVTDGYCDDDECEYCALARLAQELTDTKALGAERDNAVAAFESCNRARAAAEAENAELRAEVERTRAHIAEARANCDNVTTCFECPRKELPP